ncbi:MAG: hypothetical protein ACTHU0_36620 [Kofleriaceae bacterium]
MLAGQDDVAWFAGCKSASALVIRTAAPLDLAPLRDLETIAGDLTIGPTAGMTEVTLHELRSVGGAVQVAGNLDLRGLFFPRLVRAGRVSIDGNVALGTLAMPALREVLGSLIVVADPDLELLDVSGLVSVGKDLVIADNPKLVLLEAGKLERAEAVRIDNNKLLPADLVDGLRARMSGADRSK